LVGKVVEVCAKGKGIANSPQPSGHGDKAADASDKPGHASVEEVEATQVGGGAEAEGVGGGGH